MLIRNWNTLWVSFCLLLTPSITIIPLFVFPMGSGYNETQNFTLLRLVFFFVFSFSFVVLFINKSAYVLHKGAAAAAVVQTHDIMSGAAGQFLIVVLCCTPLTLIKNACETRKKMTFEAQRSAKTNLTTSMALSCIDMIYYKLTIKF